MAEKSVIKSKRWTGPHPEPYVSKSIRLKVQDLENPYVRVDLEFHGVDHSGASYEGRVFLNKPDANQSTPKTSKEYVGSFHVFGHGGCFGDVGHCEVKTERRPFDRRPSHPLTPAYKRINITKKMREISATTDKFTVTVVPIIKSTTELSDTQNILKFEKLSFVTYDK